MEFGPSIHHTCCVAPVHMLFSSLFFQLSVMFLVSSQTVACWLLLISVICLRDSCALCVSLQKSIGNVRSFWLKPLIFQVNMSTGDFVIMLVGDDAHGDAGKQFALFSF